MANVYGGVKSQSGGSTGVYGGKAKSRSFSGFFKNFARDVEQAATGFFVGVGGIVVDPIETAKKIYESYGESSPWGPLFVGDFGEAGRRFYSHPLGPILDVAIVASAGGAVAGTAARATGRLPKVEMWDTAIAAGKPGEVGISMKRLSPNLFTKARQKAYMKFGDSLAELYAPAGKFVGPSARHEFGMRKVASARRRATAFAARDASTLFAKAAKIANEPLSLSLYAREIFKRQYKNQKDHAIPLETDKLPRGMRYLTEESAALPRVSVITTENFPKLMDRYPVFATTKNLAKAARDPATGRPLGVFRLKSGRWNTELQSTNKILSTIWHKPQQLWKWNVLFAPRYVVNSVTGTTLMLAMTSNPIQFFGGLVSAIRGAKGLKAAEEFIDYGYKSLNQGWVKKHYLAPYEGFIGEIESQLLLREAKPKGRIRGAAVKVARAPLEYTAKLEQGLRAAAIREFVVRQPEVKSLMKERGISFDRAADLASRDPKFRARVVQDIENRMGQYYHFERSENVMRQIVPFYAWDRALVRHVRNLPAYKKDAIYNVGAFGGELVEEALAGGEDFPDSFLYGLVPFGKEGESKLGVPGMAGRIPVVSTAGANPYATVAEVMKPLFGKRPQDLMAGVTPFITAPLSVIEGRSATGEPVRQLPVPGPLGVGASAVAQIFETLPLARLVSAATGLTEQDTYTTSRGEQPFLFSKSWQEVLAAYLGIPVKQVSPKAVERRIGLAKKLGQI